MGYWANTTSQTIGATSGTPVVVDFDFELVPGEQTVTQSGIYSYAYTLNLEKPQGEPAPTRVGGNLGIKPSGQPFEDQVYGASFGIIEDSSRLVLSNHGELILNVGDRVAVGVSVFDDLTHDIMTVAQRCSFQLRKLN
jgi:hypothetical protein